MRGGYLLINFFYLIEQFFDMIKLIIMPSFDKTKYDEKPIMNSILSLTREVY